MPESNLRDLTLTSMSMFNRDPSTDVKAAVPLQPTDIVTMVRWDYFPHFDIDGITATAFRELEDLQGYRNTFWASSLRCFETQELVLASAYDIVDRYF